MSSRQTEAVETVKSGQRLSGNTPMAYTVFHLNMAFSAIEEDQRSVVIEHCYWPILRLAEQFPVGIEATGYTLDAINSLAPDWIEKLKALIAAGQVEFVGSGAFQIIGPLVAPEVTRQNLRLGMMDYERLLGIHPTLALINEQAYAPGLLPLYKEAGYKAVMMDWAEAASHHPEWPSDLAAHPHFIKGADTVMPVIWSDAISFQKFQRYAHGELSAGEYFEFLALQVEKNVLALPLYTSDAEVFDYRPGRFSSEADLVSMMEYERIRLLLQAVNNSGVPELALPSAALQMLDEASDTLVIETAAAPITVKKQRKYNLLRWAVTGQSDLKLNTHCWRLYEHLLQKKDASDQDWRTLLHAWASDFRTHITTKRWNSLQQSFDQLPKLPPALEGQSNGVAELPDNIEVDNDGRYLILQTSTGHLVLNSYRGMAIQAFGFGQYKGATAGAPMSNSLIGTLAHGYFDNIEYGADFYSGHLVFEPSDAAKVSDLSRCTPSIGYDSLKKVVVVSAEIQTAMGPLEKSIEFNTETHATVIEYKFSWGRELWGSLRLGHVMLNPRAFDARSLYFACHNGGESDEKHMLWNKDQLSSFDHGKPVSKLVSGSMALGMTGNDLVLGDDQHRIRLTMKRSDAAGVGMVSCQPVKDSFFVRGLMSLRETDETARKAPDSLSSAIEPLRVRYSIALER